MSFGFSVGDFLAAGKLIGQITLSLQEAGGSKSDYQELLRELESLDRALKHVEKLGSRSVSTATLDSIKCAALLCRHPLEEFLGKIQKYESGLGVWAKDGVKGTARKVDWALRKKEDVRKLRDYLSLHVNSINMLMLSYGLELVDVASLTASKDQNDLRELICSSQREIIEDSRALTVAIRGDISAQARLVEENNSMLTRMFRMVSGDITAPLKTLANTVVNVCITTQQILSVVLEIRSFIPPVETRFTHFQAPVKVEDALGRIFPVPSEYTFGDLEAIIQRRFRTGPGRIQVRNGNFELFNSKNRKQIISSSDALGLRPGMNLTMAIVLKELPTVGDDVCPMPHCGSVATSTVLGGGRTCDECGVWFDNSQTSKKRKEPASGSDLEDESLDITFDFSEEFMRSRRVRELPWNEEKELDAFKNIKVHDLEDLKKIAGPQARIFLCKNCSTGLALRSDILSEAFRGLHGKAFLFKEVVNITRGKSVQRNMTTGRHNVCDIFCRQCKGCLGWAYEKAYHSSETYKEGMYMLERELIMEERHHPPQYGTPPLRISPGQGVVPASILSSRLAQLVGEGNEE